MAVVGGGATGLGCAVEATGRGLRTICLERQDFGSGTSGRSTKLAHGGLRYLRNLQFGVVREGLSERRYMMNAAPHIVHRLGIVIPLYRRLERLYYGVGLHRHLSRDKARSALHGVATVGLRGGIRYFDGQFDDAQYLVALLRTVYDRGGLALNYAPMTTIESAGAEKHILVTDAESGRDFRVRARSVINATGVYSDILRQKYEPDSKPSLVFSRGAHIVLPKRFLPGQNGLLVPRTTDGRVLFALPWLDTVLVGTTDTLVNEPVDDPTASDVDIEYLLTDFSAYTDHAPQRRDILSKFAGLRPLPLPRRPGGTTARIARTHRVVTAKSGCWTSAKRDGFGNREIRLI